jgi:Serine dehydrogenase proteinase
MTPGPDQSPFFHALQADRYDRQAAIRTYEQHAKRNLVVLIGPLENGLVPPFVDALADIPPGEPLDLMLASPGGDAEAALRVAKLCHAGRDDFRVVVPNQAKSAATLLALAAERIVMSDTSDLGPVDPQVFMPDRGRFVAAKDIVAVVEDLESRVAASPSSYEWYAALLGDIDAVIYQLARTATARTAELVSEFLRCRSTPPPDADIEKLTDKLQGPSAHAAVMNHQTAEELGLPVDYLPPSDAAWQMLWRLYVKYQVLMDQGKATGVIEGRRVSLVAQP